MEPVTETTNDTTSKAISVVCPGDAGHPCSFKMRHLAVENSRSESVNAANVETTSLPYGSGARSAFTFWAKCI